MSRKIWLSLGLGLIVASSTVWLLVESHYRTASYLPLEKPFDTRQNSEFREDFMINLAEIYSLRLVLQKPGSVSEEREELKCNVQAKVLRGGVVVWERTPERVELVASTNTDSYYRLGWLDLTPGSYELVVTNLTDLADVESLNPRLTIQVTPVALKRTMLVMGITTLFCGGIALVGLVILVVFGLSGGRGSKELKVSSGYTD